MPISKSKKSSKLKGPSKGKSAQTKNKEGNQISQFLTIAPALPVLSRVPITQKLPKRSFNTFSSTSSTSQIENDEVGGCNIVTLQQTEEGKFVVASRNPLEREKNPDRICLDRRGLTTFPWIIDEPKLRLMSLQHNLISKLENDRLAQLTKLVFLDLYDNQIDKFCNFESLENLRVLLMGKNRIKKIEGLKGLSKLEVLDLHGNQIMQVSGLEESSVLKVLNLAGNNIKSIGYNDFQGLTSLKELNLRRNKIKKLFGFENTPELQKLYLSNNDIQKIEDMGSIAKALWLKEITIDGNPVNLTTECISFLVSYLPNLQSISTMQVNEQVRRTAMAWRTLKEQSNSAFLDLNAQVCVNVHREEVISNAKTNWELLRSQAKYFNTHTSKMNTIKSDHLRGSTCQSSNIVEISRLKTLNHSKSRDFGSLNVINDNIKTDKSCKKKSNSSDNLLKTDKLHQIDRLEFKLPPILAPIIDSLANNNVHKHVMTVTKTNTCLQDSTDSSSSDIESSESHQSLKSGLRNHLIKSSKRSISMDSDINCINKTLAIKNNTLDNIHSLTLDSQFETKKYLNKGTKNLFENQLECQFKKTNNHLKYDLVFKGSSLDSNKSIFGGSSTSSVSSTDKARIISAQPKKLIPYKSNRAATARANHKIIPLPSPTPQPLPLREREQGGDYLVEIVGRCLNIYGQGALRFIDKQWDFNKANEINFVKFNYVHFNGIATILNKLKTRFPNVEHFFFKETNISHLGQLNALAEAQGLNSIQIEAEGNPIISKNWKIYAVFRLAHWGLQIINGTQITEENIITANQEYSGLIDIVAWSLPEFLLQPLLQRLHLERVQKRNGEQLSAKQFLFNSDPSLRNVVAKEALQWRKGNITQDDLIWRHKGKIHLSHSIEQTVNAIHKLKILEAEWPNILHEIIYNTLLDYSDICGYMKCCIRNLEEN
ncbi:PREDICTED: leucine-rich repeat-containing protein 49 [Ceratosolen solmsi marchali]|uniref:Dynein axonemal assembly factor 1 homolog n=1 Tax=Ceratosolen solmsi marchali TaxID=326594 RepID=A0AAJ6YUP8_9HYME|nr:PREDICTED: leucine-rich repeat-containing protein 49 [Ceratosolen solmsi marchali]